MLIALLPVSVFSQSYEANLDTLSPCPGDTILVPVDVVDFNNIGAITLYIGYDTLVLEYIEHVNENTETVGVLSNAMTTPATQIGIVWSAFAAPANMGDGKFVDMKFVYLGGSCDLPFNPGCEIADYDGIPLTTNYVDGLINEGVAPAVDLGPPFDACEGTTVTLDAGDDGDTYLWSDASTDQTLDITASGTYKVTVTSASGCTAVDSVAVTFVTDPDIDLGADFSVCEGDTAIIDAGNTGDSYIWNDGSTDNYINITEPGIYSVTVTFSGCPSASDSITVTWGAGPVVELGNDFEACDGSTVTLDAGNDGDTYLWNDGSTNQTLDVTTSGTYAVTVSSAEGCTTADSVAVTFIVSPDVNLGEDINACEGDNIILYAGSGGDTYLWSDGSTNNTLQITQSGTYSVTATYSGCSSATDTVQVTINPVPVVDLGNDVDICEGESLILDAGTDGDEYIWSDGSTDQTMDVTASGTHSVTVSTTAGCSASDSVLVTIYPQPVLDLGPDTAVCEGVIVTLDAGTDGETYIWSNGSTESTILVNETGTYSVTVTYLVCPALSDTIVVTMNPNPVVDLGNDFDACEGTTITLDAGTDGDVYLWNDGSTEQTLNVDTTNTYSVTVTSAEGCLTIDSVTVTFMTDPGVDLGEDTTLCAGDSVMINAGTAAETYLWNDGSTNNTIIVYETGTYSVTVTFPGCPNATDTIEVTFVPLPVVDLGNDTSACENDTIVLDAGTDGDIYLWNDGSSGQTLNISETGTYSVTVSTAEGCSSIDTVIVNFNPLPLVDLGDDFQACEGTSVILDAGADGDTYLWNDASTDQTLDVTTTGTYAVTVTTAEGCPADDSVTVTFVTNPQIDLGEDTAVCDGETVILDAGAGGDSYVWSDGSTDNMTTVTETGEYSVTVTFSGCPAATDTINVTFLDNPVVDLGQDDSITTSEVLVLYGDPGYDEYLWNDTLACDSIILDGGELGIGAYTIWLVVVDSNGCIGMDTVVIYVVLPDETEEIEIPEPKIYPNPANDILYIGLENMPGEKVKIDIYNFTGQFMYSQEYYNEGIKEIPLVDLPSGIYIIRLSCIDLIITKKIIKN